jgi:glycosyltransferase involved in cell wall biosynthesis
MRIAILSPYPTFPFRDALSCDILSYENNASWTVTLANALAQLPDTEVHVLTESTEIPRSKTLEVNGVTLHFIKAPEQFKALTLWHFDRQRLHAGLAEIQPDIVHGQGIENQYGDAAVSSRYPNLLTVHGIPRLSNLVQNLPRFSRAQIVAYAADRCLAAARNIVIINPFIAEHLQFDPVRYQLFPISNAVAPQFFEPCLEPRESNLLLAIGWIDRLKAHDIFLRAMALLRHRGISARAIIVGPLPVSGYFESLRRYVRSEKLEVEFTNFLPPDQVAVHLRRCTVLVHPSRHDNSPVSVCEAMTCGTPVVAARVGGVSHMIRDGETGLLFESANATELADKLELLLSDTGQRKRLGDNARRYALENYQPRVVAEKTRAAYTTILNPKDPEAAIPCAALTAS